MKIISFTVSLIILICMGKSDFIPRGYYRNPIPLGPYPIRPVVYNRYAADLGDHREGSNLYADHVAKGLGREIIRDRDYVAKKGGKEVEDQEVNAKKEAGGQDFHQRVAGENYNHGGSDYYEGVNNHGVATKEGFGGGGNKGHKKGHKSTGFHKSYHNEESGKDTTFLDENHDEAEEKFGKHYDDLFNDRKWAVQTKGANNGKYGNAAAYDADVRGDIKSAGIRRINYDGLGHKGYHKGKDIIYNNDHVHAARDNHHSSGADGRHENTKNGYFI